MANVDWNTMLSALQDTLYMTFVSLIVAVLLGMGIGILLYLTGKNGLMPNKIVNKVLDLVVNILRAVPYIILLIIMIPVTKSLVGTMLGATAALPSLILSSAPFYARMCMIALNEVDKGTIEASKAMGANYFQIMTKVVLPEAKPALISSVSVMAISLVGYTAMAGAIGAGGLGNLAYLYGVARNDYTVTYIATILIIVIVFIIQGIGDYIVKKVDKR